jgi:hypothetical protein
MQWISSLCGCYAGHVTPNLCTKYKSYENWVSLADRIASLLSAGLSASDQAYLVVEASSSPLGSWGLELQTVSLFSLCCLSVSLCFLALLSHISLFLMLFFSLCPWNIIALCSPDPFHHRVTQRKLLILHFEVSSKPKVDFFSVLCK